FGNELGGFVEDVAALGVAGECEFHAQVFEHGDADFAGESAAGFAIDILSAKEKFGAGDGASDGVEIDERGSDADIDIVGNRFGNRAGQLDGAGFGEVHFPVAGDKLGAHVCCLWFVVCSGGDYAEMASGVSANSFLKTAAMAL